MRFVPSLCVASFLTAPVAIAPGCGSDKAPATPAVAVVDAATPEAPKAEPAAEPAKPAEPAAEPAKPVEPAAQNPEPPAPTAPPAEPEPARAAVDDAPARALVASWLDAQNRGDFAAYTALYADRFTGIKRAGNRTTRFDRARWVKDRQRMFSRPMKVDAADITVAPNDGAVVVTLTQTWESGTFKDVGPKQLVLVKAGAGLRIAREEMLASQLAGTTASAPDLAQSQYLPVVTAPGFVAVVLAPVASADALPIGPARSLERGRSAFAAMATQPTDAPVLELFGAQGKVCEVAAGEHGVFVDIIHHFGQIQIWDGLQDAPRVSDAVIAGELMAHGAGAFDVRKVDAKACDGALYARVKPDQAPSPALAVADAAPLAAKVATEFRKLPFWKGIQKDFDSDETIADAKGQKWDSWEARTATRAWMAADGASYVAHTVSAGTGCGTFGASAWAIWRVQGDTWTLLTDGTAPGDAFAPTAAADLDGDGQPEFTDGKSLVQPVGTVWRITRDILPPYYDCPC